MTFKKSELSERACPHCGGLSPKFLMRISPEDICRANPTYDPARFRDALQGLEEFLIYSRCRSCGMVYCPVTWREETLQKIYALAIDHEKSLEKIFSVDKRNALVREWETVLRVAAIFGRRELKGFKVVDFGCGWGDFLEVAQGPGIEAIGFEQDQEKIRFARSRGLCVVCDLEAVDPFAPADLVTLNAVIEHVQDVEDLMGRVSRWLKPGGLLVLGTMDFRPRFIQKNIRLLQAGQKPATGHLNPVEHVNVYSYDAVLKTLGKFGLKFIATRWVLEHCDIPVPLLRNTRTALAFFNFMEKILSSLVACDGFSIVVYARKAG